ncbi:hypothetical protein Pelo_3587 [Pelomyxa schiedti]|nr:hypothetical protein Pelo_3587 [Pelomyxa schiedti]
MMQPSRGSPWDMKCSREDCPECVSKLPVAKQRLVLGPLFKRWTCEPVPDDDREVLDMYIDGLATTLFYCQQRKTPCQIARIYVECGILPVLCKFAQSTQQEYVPQNCFKILFRLINQNLLNQRELLELLGPLRVLRLCEERITGPGSLTRNAAACLARQLCSLSITSEKCNNESYRPELVVALVQQIQRETIPFLRGELIDGEYNWELHEFYRDLPKEHYEAYLPRYMCMQHEIYALTWIPIFTEKSKDSNWLMEMVNRFPNVISDFLTCAACLPFPAYAESFQQRNALYALKVLLNMRIIHIPILHSTDTDALCTYNVFSKCPDIVDRLVTFLCQLVALLRSGLKVHINTLFSQLDQFHPQIPPTAEDIDLAVTDVEDEVTETMSCLCRLSAVADILPAFVTHKAIFEDIVQLCIENQAAPNFLFAVIDGYERPFYPCVVSSALIILGRLCSFAGCTTVVPKDVARQLNSKTRSNCSHGIKKKGFSTFVLVENLWFPDTTPYSIDKFASSNFKECGWCGKPMQSLRCTRCTTTYYCNQVCQKKDWPHHKASCRPPSKPSPPPSTTATQSQTTTTTTTTQTPPPPNNNNNNT